MTDIALLSQRVGRWWNHSVSQPLRWLEVNSIRLMGTHFTMSVLTVCILFMTIGVTDLQSPARQGFIIIGMAGVVVGIGSQIVGCTYVHLRWMGFVLVMYGLVGMYATTVTALEESDGFWEFLVMDHLVWVWALVTFFGGRLIVFPSHVTVSAVDKVVDIQTAGAQAEIDIRRKD